jgi:MFS superfamily sulfate permease-like transporter
MKPFSLIAKRATLFFLGLLVYSAVQAQADYKTVVLAHTSMGLVLLMLAVACAMLVASLFLLYRIKGMQAQQGLKNEKEPQKRFEGYIKELGPAQIETFPEHNIMHPANSRDRSALSAAPYSGLPSY